MNKENLINKIVVLGTISKHQWGMVISGGGIAQAEVSVQHKFPQIVVRKWQSESGKQRKKDI